MTTPHHKPVNVRLTGNSALRKAQSLGSTYEAPEAPRDRAYWSKNEGIELSCRALERMIANGWQGYGCKKRRPRKLSDREVRAWMRLNVTKAREMLADIEADLDEEKTLRLANAA